MIQAALIFSYLGMAVAGNLVASAFGPWATPFIGFFAIGFDLTMRDVLHQGWQERGVLRRNMGALIATGSLLTVVINHHASRIAIASTVAYSMEATASTIVYWMMFSKARLVKMNTANCVGGMVDSVVFPTIAFNRWMPMVVITQWGAKFLGGAIWAFIVVWMRRRQQARLAMTSYKGGMP